MISICLGIQFFGVKGGYMFWLWLVIMESIFKNHRGKSMNGFGGDPANIHRLMDIYN